MVATPLDNEILKKVWPVWSNVEKARHCIGIFEGISKYALELNSLNHGLFFGYTQSNAIESAVIAICKLYDTSNKRYKKHTIPELINYLIDSPSKATARDNIDMCTLGISRISELESVAPSKDNNAHLKKMLLFRDKTFAHEECLDDKLKRQLSHLPPTEEMKKIIGWSSTFCMFFVDALTDEMALVESTRCARMSTLNVVKKLLGRNFNDPKKSVAESLNEMKEFYAQ